VANLKAVAGMCPWSQRTMPPAQGQRALSYGPLATKLLAIAQAEAPTTCPPAPAPVRASGAGHELTRVTNENLGLLLALMPDAAVAVDATGVVVRANDRASAMFGYPPRDLEGKAVEVLVPEHLRHAHRRDRAEYSTDPHARPMGAGLELHGRRADGSTFPVDISLAPLQGEAGLVVVAAVRDMTERKATEARLAVATDRERIARDLHDLVIQRLFGAGLRLQAALALIDNEAVATRVASTVDELDMTIKEIRETIFALEAPPGPSFEARLQQTLAEVTDVLGFEPRLSFQCLDSNGVPPEVEVEALAVVREALSNAARHAHASRVEVYVSVGPELVVRVVDDGVGIGQPSRLSGLANARARADRMGGRLEVRAQGGGGTCFEWRAPLRGAPKGGSL